MPLARQLSRGRRFRGVASLDFRFGGPVWDMGLELDEKLHCYSSALRDELLAAVDVVRCSGDRGINHEVNR
jgi:hypothetical protein